MITNLFHTDGSDWIIGINIDWLFNPNGFFPPINLLSNMSSVVFLFPALQSDRSCWKFSRQRWRGQWGTSLGKTTSFTRTKRSRIKKELMMMFWSIGFLKQHPVNRHRNPSDFPWWFLFHLQFKGWNCSDVPVAQTTVQYTPISLPSTAAQSDSRTNQTSNAP